MKKNDIETQSEGAETADADWIVMRIGDLAMLHIMSPEIRSDVNLEIEKSDHENPESLIKAMRALERRSDSRV